MIIRIVMQLVGGAVLSVCVWSTDTTTYRAKELRVEAPRYQLRTAFLESRATRLSDSEIVILHTRQSADLLQFVSGSYVRDYGGLGGLKTVSLRGATAAQSAVTLDGVRLNSTQNGLFDFSTLPSYLIQSISLRDAADDASSKANAIGGVIALETHHHVDSVFHLTLQTEYGSWAEWCVSAQSSIPLSRGSGILMSAEHRSCEGDYPFQFNNFGKELELRRKNADVSLTSGTLSWVDSDSTRNSSTRVIIRTSERGAPAAITQGNIDGLSARLEDQNVFVLHRSIMHVIAEHEFEVNLYGSYGQQHFVDSSRQLLGVVIDNSFIARDAGLRLRYQRPVLGRDQAVIESDLSYNDLRGDLLRFNAGTQARRSLFGLGVSYRTTTLELSSQSVLYALLGLRFDCFSDGLPMYSPQVALLTQLGSRIELRLNGGMAYRQPSFNELYYQNYGNTNLEPERSVSGRCGLECLVGPESSPSDIRLSGTVFAIATRNQIVATPRSPVTWSAVNVANVRSVGIESACQYRISRNIHLRVGYTFQDVRDTRESDFRTNKLIPYTPQHIGYGTLDHRWDILRWGCSAQWTGARYTQTDNAEESKLAAYLTTNIFALVRVPLATMMTSFRIDIDNLFDARYSIVVNYPMPGRRIRAGVSTEF